MKRGCPSDLLLEGYLADPARAPAGDHVVGCDECAARVAVMRAQGAEFRTKIFPQTVDGMLARHAAGHRRGRVQRWLFGIPVFALPAAAALLLVVRPGGTAETGPRPDRTQIKGARGVTPETIASLPFAVFVGAADGVRTVRDGSTVPSDAQLRFQVTPPEKCWFSVVSVDRTGQLSRLYPDAPTGVEVPQPSLPGGAILDGQAGPERLFALCSPRPLAFDDIEKAARSAITPAESAVRGTRQLPGLPPDVLQGTVLLEKVLAEKAP